MGEMVEEEEGQLRQHEMNPQDAWLPITESRKGNSITSSFLLFSSGFGFQALMLPISFTSLGWYWGTTFTSIAFTWQLYTIWLLVHLHQSTITGTRYSRFLHLSIVAFGEKLGKLLAVFPVIYLSGATCVFLIINGGGLMELIYQTVFCDNESASGPTCTSKTLFSETELWFLLFTCLAILLGLFFPNLYSMARVSLVGSTTAVGCIALMWVLIINSKGPTEGVSYDRPSSKIAGRRMDGIVSALGIIALAFRGHNLVLEIQGTLPSSSKHPSHEKMWKGVKASYLLIAVCLFPLTVGVYWAYGNTLSNISYANGGLLRALPKLHGHKSSKLLMGMIYLLIGVSYICTFQICAMVVFDNLERIYVTKKNKPCPRWIRLGIKIFFGGLTFFVSVALPFLGALALLLGGLTLPLTFAYPCFMWIAIKKPRPKSPMWYLNMGLGCLGILFSVLLAIVALWDLVSNGLDANFFNPH